MSTIKQNLAAIREKLTELYSREKSLGFKDRDCESLNAIEICAAIEAEIDRPMMSPEECGDLWIGMTTPPIHDPDLYNKTFYDFVRAVQKDAAVHTTTTTNSPLDDYDEMADALNNLYYGADEVLKNTYLYQKAWFAIERYKENKRQEA